MKEWLRIKLIEKLKGFPDVETALEAITDPKKKHDVLTAAVKKLYNTIGPEDILKENEYKEWLFEGKLLPEGEKKLLIAEATQFMDMKFWKVLQADIKYQANRKMFILSKNDIDLIMGKSWLFVLDSFRTRLRSMRQGSPLLNNKE